MSFLFSPFGLLFILWGVPLDYIYIIALNISVVHWQIALTFSVLIVQIIHLILVQSFGIFKMTKKVVNFMAIKYKIDILAELKKIGYSSTRIREEKLIGQSYLQQLRHGELVSWKTLDTICSLLVCQPADLIEYVKDEE